MRVRRLRLRGLLVAATLLIVVVCIPRGSNKRATMGLGAYASPAQVVSSEPSPSPRRSAAGLTVVRAFQDRDAEDHGASSSVSIQSDDDDDSAPVDVLEPSLTLEDDDARTQSAVERAEMGLESLRRQAPDHFLQLFSLMEASRRFSKLRVDEAREATRVYLERRAQLLEQSWRRFIDSHGEQIDGPELSELRELERSFRATMARFGPALPGTEELASLIAATSHPLPFFVATQDS